MPDEIVPWLFENEHLVRTVEIKGDPWWVTSGVCASIEIKNSRDAAARLDDDERGVAEIDTPGGRQTLSIVSEPGLYKLVGRSNKPAAKRFDRWGRHDVLPAIRKTGRYEASVPPNAEPIVHRGFDEWTPAELNARVGAVAEYRQSIGPQAGQWAMQRFGFPMPPAHVLPRSRQYELDLRANPGGL